LTELPFAQWRLIHSPLSDGATNMAIDEAILLGIAEGSTPPTLRFFHWSPPCLSLGYAQPGADVDRSRLEALGWDLVRRPTGGRAILHTDELTYSVAAPVGEPRMLGGILESYRRLSTGLMAGLIGLGVRAEAEAKPQKPEGMSEVEWAAVCFEVPSHYEITAGGKKLLGSAQVRRRGAVLQHGSLPLHGDIARICDGLRFASEEQRATAKARVRSRATTVAAALAEAGASPQPSVTWADAAGALARGLAERLNLELVEAELTSAEVERAETLRRERYAAEVWTLKL
jgi:lipoate-protein ligase A